jgi:ligand-binding sensor domain-containing protein
VGNLWIGTLGAGLDIFNRKTSRFEHYQNKEAATSPVPLNFISAILQDRKGNLWIGTVFGVIVFQKDKTTQVYYHQTNRKSSLSDNNVSCFLEDSKGRIWVGTREGLNLFDERTGTFKVFTTSDGLPDNIILNILEDDHQTLWLSTANGLCSAILRETSGGTGLFVVNYDEMNNLLNREFNDNAALKTRQGELIFGGPSGFNIINPGKVQESVGHPKIVFTGLQILNNNVEPGELINNRILLKQSLSHLPGIDLKYKENVFSIEFASLDFTRGVRDKYA